MQAVASFNTRPARSYNGRHCEEQSDEAIQPALGHSTGLHAPPWRSQTRVNALKRPRKTTFKPGYWSSLGRAAQVAARSGATAGRRDRHAIIGIFVELVPQRPDRNSKDVGRVRAVAEAVLERLEDEVALDIGDRAPHQRARDGFGREG